MPLNHTELEDRWHRLWRALGAAPAAGAFDYLCMQYSEPGRHYHTLEHIAACLEHFDSWRHLADKPHLVELALWLHDVIYDTHRVDNEACSAQYAIALLTAAGVPEYAPAVEAMIMATTHQTGSQADDCGLVLDIDLAVLAQPPQAYKSYQQAVQQEFAWVSGASMPSTQLEPMTATDWFAWAMISLDRKHHRSRCWSTQKASTQQCA